MAGPILATKLFIPPPRPKAILRPHLIERLNEGLHRKLTLISAPAGFGKTTLVSEWIADFRLKIADYQTRLSRNIITNQQSQINNLKFAWLSLDEGDNDPTRFLAYLVAALQTIVANLGAGVLGVLQAPQPPPTESILTALLNEIATIPDNFVLVLDDYHVIDAKPVDNALIFLLKHLPPQMHLVIATREDPQLPLARLRARGQLTELRAMDLRFTSSEAAGFLNQVMGLNLSAEDIAALETRTEGWIAGLQLAALALQGTISMQGHQDAASFIKSFTGSHHFVMDYLVEEVLHLQSESVQNFLLRTSILDRLCGPLCDAVVGTFEGWNVSKLSPRDREDPSHSSKQRSNEILAYLDRANLFIVPLDNERRWYRYHHLFADLLRQRLSQSVATAIGDERASVAELHTRASIWYENNGFEGEAFHHAVAAHDVDRAAYLVEGNGMPLIFRGVVTPVVNWLESLPSEMLDSRPALWVIYASALLIMGQLKNVELKLQAAETALQSVEQDDKTKDLIGHIAAIRATLAILQNQADTVIAQSRRALEYLHPNNLPVRTSTIWTLGEAYQMKGERAAARQAYSEAIAISQTIGHVIINLLATIGLGNMQEADNQLCLAAETYQHVLQLAGDPPLPVACEAHFGLAHIYYEWNDLDAAHHHAQQSIQLARQIESNDRFVTYEVFLARLKLAQGDAAGAAALLDKISQYVRQHNFVRRIPEVAAVQVLASLQQGNLAAAAHLAETHELPLSQARVHLARGDPSAALSALEPFRQQAEVKGWQDERLKAMVLQAVAHHARGEKNQAVGLLGDALALAEPGGFIRIFVDAGEPMRLLILDFRLWIEKQSRGQDNKLITYVDSLLAAFARPATTMQSKISNLKSTLIEPLSLRELEVLQLIAQGLSNREISERLFLALSTVKGHNRIIFGKLQVQRRTEAVKRARELGLL